MKALSIRQPWAWLIVHGWKPVENRSWPTQLRGRVLVHASKGMTRDEYDEGVAVARMAKAAGELEGLDVFPAFSALERGGIVGAVDIVDCVQEHQSAFFFGPHGFVLANAEVLPFREYKGQLGFFEVTP